MSVAGQAVFLPGFFLCGASQEVIIALLWLAPIPLIAAGILFLWRKIFLGLLVGILLVAFMEYGVLWGRTRIVSTCMPICFGDEDCREIMGRWRADQRKKEAADAVAVLAPGFLDVLILFAAAKWLNRPEWSDSLVATAEPIPGRVPPETPADKQSGASDGGRSFRFHPLPKEEPHNNN